MAFSLFISLPGQAEAHDGYAPCPVSDVWATDPPSGDVVVKIKGAQATNAADDDYPLFTNRADIKGVVTINGSKYNLPLINGDNTPTWNTEGDCPSPCGRFEYLYKVDPENPHNDPVNISITLVEDDDTSGDNTLDINPDPAKKILDFQFDTCSLQLSGDVRGGTQDDIQVWGNAIGSGGEVGSDWAKATFSVEFADGRPLTTDDLALVEVKLVQVVHDVPDLVAGKPTVLMATVANNFSETMNTKLEYYIGWGNDPRIHPIVHDTYAFKNLNAGEVRKEFIFRDDPLIIPPPPDGVGVDQLSVLAYIDPTGAVREEFNKEPDDCRNLNDFAAYNVECDYGGECNLEKAEPSVKRVVIKSDPLNVSWAKVWMGAESMVDDEPFYKISKLGSNFIEATYPFPKINRGYWGPPCVPALSMVNKIFDTLWDIVGIPAGGVTPFMVTFECGLYSWLAFDSDRNIGVVPDNWFSDITRSWWDPWAGRGGVSLGDVFPRFVLLEASDIETAGDGTTTEIINATLPAHELGHTFGLSQDPNLKDSIFCGSDDPVSSLICFATEGYDEYAYEDPVRWRGNPSRGFWVGRDGVEPELLGSGMAGEEQCNSHCFMGGSAGGGYDDWGAKHSWIDADDYKHLLEHASEGLDFSGDSSESSAAMAIRSLDVAPETSEVIYVQGMIAYYDDGIEFFEDIELTPWFRVPYQKPDRTDGAPGFYGFRFLDEAGNLLQEIGLPMREPSPSIPVTFFGQVLPFPAGTRSIQIWNRFSEKLLAERIVSTNAPSVTVNFPQENDTFPQGYTINVSWDAVDRDGGVLYPAVLLSNDGTRWSPASPGFDMDDKDNYDLDTSFLEQGSYFLKVIVSDGVNVGESQIVAFEITSNNPPNAYDDAVTIDEDSSVTVDVAANDTDQDGNLDPTTVNTVCARCTSPASGTLTNDGNGTFTYSPNLNFNGTDSFVYQVCDAGGLCDTATVTIIINPVNDPPVAVCKGVTVVAGESCTANASIENGSYDPEEDSITLRQSPAEPYPLGSSVVTLAVTDSNGASSQCTGTVTVTDNTPPTIGGVAANPPVLWPPNQKMVSVIAGYVPADNCGQPTCQIASVSSNEPIDISDYAIVDAHHVSLRAERLENGSGRNYTIGMTCVDASGNSAGQTVTVSVPHDQGEN